MKGGLLVQWWSLVFMGQKCGMNEHIMARNSEQGIFLYHFWTNRFALYYLNKIPENRPLRNSLPET